MVEQSLHLALLGSALAVAAARDVAERRVPNLIVAPLAAAGLAAQLAAGGPGALLEGALAGGAALLLLLLPWMAGGLGGGDVKLAAAAAVWLGPSRLAAFLLFTAVAGGPVALAARAAHRQRARRELARVTSAGLGLDAAELPRETAPVAVAIALGAIAALRWGLP
ncbi:MAG TPA: prepilin peptidase [Anaeromyxobacteraceae bacterium]|nr:prepilin peptidase [Anaeromyxobacteraceae bacterium]